MYVQRLRERTLMKFPFPGQVGIMNYALRQEVAFACAGTTTYMMKKTMDIESDALEKKMANDKRKMIYGRA